MKLFYSIIFSFVFLAVAVLSYGQKDTSCLCTANEVYKNDTSRQFKEAREHRKVFDVSRGVTYTIQTVLKLLDIQKKVEKTSSLHGTFVKVALEMLNIPYVAGSIERVPEQLIISMEKTDCILFVETALAIAVNIQNDSFDIKKLGETVKGLRYRDGVINGYTSRIHYTSEWALQAEKNGILLDITKDLGGKVVNDSINFMSKIPNAYKELKDNVENQNKIKDIEKELNKHQFYYIPKQKVPSVINKLRCGDIVAFDTAINGLDISHVGIVYVNNGKTTFIHASQKYGKVVVESKSLVEYINGIKSNSGIRIYRPVD